MLFTEDATYYAKVISEKKSTSETLVKRALENIEKLNPLLNAVVHIQEKEAIQQAKTYDRELLKMSKKEREELPPFYGVPILLKDVGDAQKGQPTTNGSRLLTGTVSKENNHFIDSLLSAGFVVVGRTNVPEFGLKNTTDSELFGPVYSPIDLTRNPGGSSGGAAAALKAGIVPIASASDGGGSIRMPASFTGLIGLKPSRGRFMTGPGNYRRWQGAATNFALTKTVRDVWSLFKWLQTEQKEAVFIEPLIQETELSSLDRPLKIAYQLDTLFEGETVDNKAKEALEKGIHHLEKFGHQVIEAKPKIDNKKILNDYYMMTGVETAVTLTEIEKQKNRNITQKDMEPMTWALYQHGLAFSAVDYSKMVRRWDNLSVTLEHFYEEYDVMLMPTTNGIAPKQDQFKDHEEAPELLEQIQQSENLDGKKRGELVWKAFEERMKLTPFVQRENLTGQTAISLPIYETKEGLPLGIQLSARKGGEYVLMQLAKQFEEVDLLKTDIVDLKNNGKHESD